MQKYTTTYEEERLIKARHASGETFTNSILHYLPWLRDTEFRLDEHAYPEIITILYDETKTSPPQVAQPENPGSPKVIRLERAEGESPEDFSYRALSIIFSIQGIMASSSVDDNGATITFYPEETETPAPQANKIQKSRMTAAQARVKARQLWGSGFARLQYHRGEKGRKAVGKFMYNGLNRSPYKVVLGSGDTWEEAFADALKRGPQ